MMVKCNRCTKKIIKRDRRKGYCRSCYHHVYLSNKPWEYRTRMNGKERTINLSLDFLQMLRESSPFCQCCGQVLNYEMSKGPNRPNNKATLDKLIPENGYVPSNVAIICFRCNSKKQDCTLAELQMIIDYIKKQLVRDR